MLYLLWRYKLLKSSSKEGFGGIFRRKTITGPTWSELGK
jgi:hypothetical protein